MIKGIILRDLRNAEYLQFSRDVLGIVTLNNITVLDVGNQYIAYENSTNEIESLFALDQGSDITPLIEALDKRRDNAIMGITLLVNAMTVHYDPAYSAAATKLSDHIRLFGGSIARENYAAETASISSMIADWTNDPELAAAINTLGLSAWKAELNTANQLFNTNYLARTQELGAANPDTMLEKRQASLQCYYALRDRIAAFNTLNNGANPWGKTVHELNALIEQYNTLLAGRASHKEPTPPPQG